MNCTCKLNQHTSNKLVEEAIKVKGINNKQFTPRF